MDSNIKIKDPIVYCLSKASRCHNCDAKLLQGEIAKMENLEDEREIHCKSCSGLADYVLLPPGNAKLTRLGKKHSKQVFVVMKWSELWKTYERVGLLLEASAVERAKIDLG